ncbi:sensor histidine kinase [Petroclostridium xylanilyticum]|jgi:two-component system sensor histidine kinase YesM|uniref:sensor histidine kinase n=1 Tax=Petroclostridium xylanilyticum TaxID=1792311 RepID=UPI000B99AFB2|nr:histidine kinase [Petroclostridium xylanilyticum]
MSFQTKLLLTYSLLIILLVVTLGVSFYQYSAGVFEANAYSNLAVISEKMSQQLDNLIRPMDFIMTYLLSSGSFMSSMASIANLDRDNPENLVYINEGIQTIKGTLLSYSMDKNFYRVSVFNNKGDFLSSNFRTHNVSHNLLELIHGLGWTARADSSMGKVVILPPYADPWALSDNIKVFGLARSVQGPNGGMGYIEVQNPYRELEKIFAVPDQENIKVVAVTSAGEIFYNSGITDSTLLDYYSKLPVEVNKPVSVERNLVTGKDEILARTGSGYTGIKIILVQDKDALLKPLLFTGNITIIVGILVIIISFIYIYIFSKQLARPIRQLKQKMECIELGNLPEKIIIKSSNNEIEALNNAFQRLRERLNEAVSREIKSQSLQMQASFDSLQAQVNPHFIYNILNVLSNKGIVNGDDEICEICDSIAAMLRYSTSTLKRSATIGEELEHVRNYLLLMKKRFEHRLEFNIDVDPAICGQAIPKIVLQQIVENSINHGFEKLQKIMKIGIRGYVSDGWWYIEITDNGQGFDQKVLCELEERIKLMEKELFGVETHTGFAIGGMGIINTYARLALFYNGRFVFTLKNTETGGAQVTIGGAVEFAKGSDEK